MGVYHSVQYTGCAILRSIAKHAHVYNVCMYIFAVKKYTYTKRSDPNEYKQIPCFMKEEHFIPQTKTWSNRIVKPCLNSFHVLSYLSEMKLPKNRGNVTKTKGSNNSFMKSFYSYGENITAFHFSPVKNLHTGI